MKLVAPSQYGMIRHEWQSALHRLTCGEEDKTPAVVTYSKALAAQRKSHWPKALHSLQDLQTNLVQGHAVVWTAAVGSNDDWPRAVQMLRKMQQYAIQANVITFSSMMGNWKVAQQILQEMKRHHVRWDVASCNASLRCSSSSPAWPKALIMLRSMAERGLQPNWTSKNICIALSKNWQKVLLLAEDLLGFSSSITKCPWLKGARILQELQEKHLEPDLITFNATMTSWGHGSRWPEAMDVLFQLSHYHLRSSCASWLPVLQASWRNSLWFLPRDAFVSFSVSEFTRLCGAAISACVKGDRWRHALRLHSDFSFVPNSLTYNSAISACEEGAHWLLAMALMTEMQDAGLEYDLFTWNSAISTLEKRRRWQEALQLFTVSPRDVLTFAATLKATRRGFTSWQLQVSLMEELEPSSVSPNAICCDEAVSTCEFGGRWQQQRLLLAQLPQLALLAMGNM